MKGKDDKIVIIVEIIAYDKENVQSVDHEGDDRFMKTTGARILKANGECSIFDQLILWTLFG